MSKTTIKNTNHTFGKRPHYELKELQTWSEDTLIEYIILTMQRKASPNFARIYLLAISAVDTIAQRAGTCCFGHSWVATDIHTNGHEYF